MGPGGLCCPTIPLIEWIYTEFYGDGSELRLTPPPRITRRYGQESSPVVSTPLDFLDIFRFLKESWVGVFLSESPAVGTLGLLGPSLLTDSLDEMDYAGFSFWWRQEHRVAAISDQAPLGPQDSEDSKITVAPRKQPTDPRSAAPRRMGSQGCSARCPRSSQWSRFLGNRSCGAGTRGGGSTKSLPGHPRT